MMGRYSCSGAEALMRLFHTPPSARYVSLFPRMKAPGLNQITYRLMPQGTKITEFPQYLRYFGASRVVRRPKRKPTP